MANKSFVVQYVIRARDKFSESANRVSDSTRKMKDSIRKSKESFVELSASMRKTGAIMSAAVTVPILLAANSLKNAASDAVEARSKFSAVFSSIGSESETAADKLAKSFGLSGTNARMLLGDTGDLLSGFGFTQKASLDLSTQVNSLAVDLASFTNFSGGAKGASDALTKALLGERESLKSLGIAILEKDVKTKVSQMVAEGHRFESLRQAKAVATLALATEQSKNAIGDFARTSGDLANQERITSSRIQDLKESFGKLLLPVALKITKAVRSVVEWLDKLSPKAKKIILVIVGIVAIVGPLLLALGSLAIILPMISAGFVAIGVTSLAALAPIAAIAVGIAAAAYLIYRNWGKVSAFFRGFSKAIRSHLGPVMDNLAEKFSVTAGIIAELFAPDGEAATNFKNFANIGELVGNIIGKALSLIIRSISGVGEALGQLIGAVSTMDFSHFDPDAIMEQFTGEKRTSGGGKEIKALKGIWKNQDVNVDVNVGLDGGLKQTEPARVGRRYRRQDVGAFAQ